VTAFEEKQYMIKKWSFYTTLTIIIAFLSSGFKASELESNEWFLINETDREILHWLQGSYCFQRITRQVQKN